MYQTTALIFSKRDRNKHSLLFDDQICFWTDICEFAHTLVKYHIKQIQLPKNGNDWWKCRLIQSAFLAGTTLIFTENDEILEPLYPYREKFDERIFNDYLEITEEACIRYPDEFYLRHDDIACIIETSGSQGQPGLVPLTFEQILSAAECSRYFINHNENQSWLLSLPINHIGGYSVLIRSLLMKSPVTISHRNNTQTIIETLIRDKSITTLSLVPTQLKRLLTDVNKDIFEDRSITILLGGGPSSVELINSAIKMKIRVITSYGMTETAAQITAYLHTEELKSEEIPVGFLFKNNDYRLINDYGDCIEDEGWLYLKGKQIFSGYLNKDTPISDGWFNTGDYAKYSPELGLFIKMRRQDLVISGGKNIDTQKVKLVLESLDIIDSAIVFGIDDEEWGQKCVATVKLSEKIKDKSLLNLKKIKELTSTQLHSFEFPKIIIKLNELPVLPNGKVDLQKIKNHYFKDNS